MSTIHDFCDKLRSDVLSRSVCSKKSTPLKKASFLYALKLESIDQFYWGCTESLIERMQGHFDGDTKSTCKEAKDGKLLLLLALPFQQISEAKQEEERAWRVSGGSSKICRDESGNIIHWGWTDDKDRTFKHLFSLGWECKIRPDKARIELSEFINLVTISKRDSSALFSGHWNEFVTENLNSSRKAA